MKPNPQNLAEDLRRYVESQRHARAALVEEQTKLTERREVLFTAPLCTRDIKQFIRDHIDVQATRFSELVNFKQLFENIIYPKRAGIGHPSDGGGRMFKPEPLCLRDVDLSLSGDHNVFGFSQPCFFTGGQGINFLDRAACFYFGDAIKARIEQYFEEFNPGLIDQDQVRVGPPIAKRREELLEIEVRLVEVDSEIALIDTGLSAISAPLEDPKVVELEQQRRKAEAARLRDRQIVSDYNGRNEEEIAKKFKISVNEVKAIVNSRDAQGL